MKEVLLPTPVITSLNHEITDRCNFRCGHCLEGDQPVQHNVTPSETRTIYSKLKSPNFSRTVLFGGEPRIHSQFDTIVTTIKDIALESGRFLFLDQPDSEKKNYEDAVTCRDEYLSHFDPKEKMRLRQSGELGIMISHYLDTHSPYKGTFSINVYTNGFGMKDEASTGQIISQLAKLGVSSLTVSMDQPHRDYVSDHHIPIDYDAIQRFNNKDVLDKYGIPQRFDIGNGGVGNYVIPIGRATSYSWDQRLVGYNKNLDQIKAEITDEFDYWNTGLGFSHICYCRPAKFIHQLSQVRKYQPENQENCFNLNIDSQGYVQTCILRPMPSPGNLLSQSVDEIYQTMATNQLYQLIAAEGPQGLARRLTIRSEAQIKEQFIESTPCGLCQDLVTRYPLDFQALMDNPVI